MFVHVAAQDAVTYGHVVHLGTQKYCAFQSSCASGNSKDCASSSMFVHLVTQEGSNEGHQQVKT